MKEFNLNLNNKKKLLSDLEEISLICDLGAVFSSPIFRMESGQEPYEIKKITLYTKSKEEINYFELKRVIENNLGPSVLSYHNNKTGDLIQTYFLPEAIGNNPSKRKLITETNIDKRLKWFIKNYLNE